ncbi:MAG: alpha/beta fold hydrolase [Jiangellaceae bacterium]
MDVLRRPRIGWAFDRPALILTGRQDRRAGFADQYALLPHYPRATFVVLDEAGHNAQFEQPVLFEALMAERLDHVEWESGPRPAS